MNLDKKTEKKLLIGALVIIFIFIIFFFIIEHQKSLNHLLIIKNFDQNIKNISSEDKDDVQSKLYSYIAVQNDINNKENKSYYHGIIRKDSLKTSEETIDNQKIHFADFILDIESLKYSYQVQFYWFDKNNTALIEDADLGTTNIFCLEKDQSIYEDFNCEQNPLVTPKEDDIMSTNLVLNQDCWGSLFSSPSSKSGYGIKIFYHPVSEDYTNNSIEASFDTCIKDYKKYLEEQNLILENYEFISQIKYFYNY